MASRAVGALLGFTAAAALGVSIARPAWWEGHPTIAGHEIAAKDAHVGLIQAVGCNTGGAGDCQSFALDDTVQYLAWGVAGAAALAALLALLVAIGALREKGKLAGKLAIVMVAIAGIGGGGLVLLGPAIVSTAPVEVPLGWAMFVFFGGVAACLLASILVLAAKPQPLRLKSRALTPPGLPDFDVASLTARDSRPRAQRNDFTEDVGTLPTPLFDGSASQPAGKPFAESTRPTGAAFQGINLAMAETLASNPPPPVRAESEPIGPPAPVVMPKELQPRSSPKLVPLPPSAIEAAASTKPKTLPRPDRVKPPTAPPARTSTPIPQRPSQPALSKATLAHKVPPPPETTPPPSVKTGRLATEQDPRLDHAMRETEAITSVEVDAEAKAAARADTEASETHDTGVEIHQSATIQAQMEIPPDDPAAAAEAEAATRPATQVPMSTAPTSLPPPKAAPTMPSGPTPACPQCESPMAWVEEHLRFYCKQCRMYF